MLNINSPTVQAMFKNTPVGVGNFETFSGPTPTFTNDQTAVNGQQSFHTPYPSPKEMLTQYGQISVPQIAQPVSFQQNMYAPGDARNLVGGYNPNFNPYFNGYGSDGFQRAFSGYYNPYMIANPYNGMTYMQVDQLNQIMSNDPDMKDIWYASQAAGIDYQEHVETISGIFRGFSRTVSKNINRSEEDAKKCEEQFAVREKETAAVSTFNSGYSFGTFQNTKKYPLFEVEVVKGDKVISDSSSDHTIADNYSSQNYRSNVNYAIRVVNESNNFKYGVELAHMQMHNNAIERQFDNVSLLEYMNEKAPIIYSAYERAEIERKKAANLNSTVYNTNEYKKRLYENNSLKSRYINKAVERHFGRYGVMPDGRPVSPGHDPAIAESFSINTNTGYLEVTAPNFIKNRLEAARQNFIDSIGK